MGHQRLPRQRQTFIQQFPECGFVAFASSQRDARQVKATPRLCCYARRDLLAVSFSHTPRKLRLHWRFERTGDFDHLIVVEDVRIHAARALQRQLFNVVKWIAKLVVQTVADSEDQFQTRGFAIFTQTGDTVTQK